MSPRPADTLRRAWTVGLGAILSLSLLASMSCAAEPEGRSQTTVAPSLTPPESSPEKSKASPTINELAAERVSRLSVREQAAAITMGAAPGTDAASLAGFVSRTRVGGVILMGDNILGSSAELADITAELDAAQPGLPLLIAIDQEGGEVTRLPWDTLPSAITLKSRPPSETADAFTARAELLADAGVNINFGIVADVTPDSAHFIYSRALGSSAEEASARVAAAVAAESGTVFSTLKHFPGHGATLGDSHLSVPSSPMTLDEWETTVAPPFVSGIGAGAELLMYGHLEYSNVDSLPASLSPEWHRIAREELGFAGVSVTDDLGMLLNSGAAAYRDPVRNAVLALAAGNDLLLWIAGADEANIIEMIDGVTLAVESGEVPEERLKDAATRVTALSLSLADDRD